MNRRISTLMIAMSIAIPAAPSFAQSVFETHTEQAGPAGKIPTKAYRPLANDDCRTARNFHQTGKIPLTPQVAVSQACRTQFAARATTDRRD